MKVIAFYLPQFHTFPENDEWWGKGFTEWTNTKKAIPFFEGHHQPQEPLDSNYYNLLDEGVMKWQIELAKKYGIYGFCFYHYWFGGKLLMEKPVENFLKDENLKHNFCLCWANESWTRRWDGGEKNILIEQKYGDKKEWKKHFEYLLPYFRDKRYICIDDKPVVVIYRPDIMNCYNEMIAYWRELALENGLKGLYILGQGTAYCNKKHIVNIKDETDACIMYEPGYTYASIKPQKSIKLWINNIFEFYPYSLKHLFSTVSRKLVNKFSRADVKLNVCDFNILWNTILRHKVKENFYPGAFATWDNTARRGRKARIVTGSSPKLFKEFFSKQIIRARDEYEKDYIFFTAWNEWAEGSHLEPDKRYKYEYLEAVRDSLMENNEWPFEKL